MSTDDVRANFIDAVELFHSRVSATPNDAWSSPSPCEGWTARDVVAHVVTNLRALRACAAGDDFLSHFGKPVEGDIAAAWVEQHAAASSVADRLATVESITLGGNSVAPEMLIDALTRDLVIHTWDLARAVGGDERLPDALVAVATESLQAAGPEMRAPGLYGEAIHPPTEATPQAKLLALSGRDPN